MDLHDMLIAGQITGNDSGGGGGEAVLINKDISANGTYNASSDNADGYKKVNVNVPNTYTQSDEGKVVSSGQLAVQSSLSVTENGTYDTTLKNSVSVNVSGGGGVDLSDLLVFIGDYTHDPITLSLGSVDKYYRRIYGQ